MDNASHAPSEPDGAVLRRRAAAAPLRAIGLMSGTSLDGVDVALVETDGETVRGFGPAETYPYDEDSRAAVRAVLGREAPDADTRLAEREVTDAHAEAVQRFIAAHGIDRRSVDVVGFHGQTISHRPERGHTWQIGDAQALARRIALPVVADFRSADVQAGGQGAPLVPVFHRTLLAGQGLPAAVVNVGGVANVTWVGPDRTLLAFDVGPGNAPLDDWVRRTTGAPMDRGGALAAAGTTHSAAVATFLASDYFRRPAPKSLDRQDFSIDLPAGATAEDGAATITRCIAEGIARAAALFPQAPTRWILCGGGARNPTLVRFLAGLVGEPVVTAADLGWMGDAIEAQAFAVLAVRSLRRLPLSFPETTGVPVPMPGGRLHLP